MQESKLEAMKERRPTGQDKRMSKKLSARRDAEASVKKGSTGRTMPGSMKRNGK